MAMRKCAWLAVIGMCGCADHAPEATPAPDATAQVAASESAGMKAATAETPAGDAAAAASATSSEAATTTSTSSTVALTEANTKVEFVGVHSDVNKPDPRKGSFGKLSGTATLDAGTLKAVVVEFDTNSLTTEMPKLTEHLKSPDFFDVKQYPTAKFESTSIEPAEGGQVTITGNLTMLGNTKPVTFPATVTADGGLKLSAEFSIDRAEFGMTYGEGKVENKVSLTVTIGG